jgi:hypothetical protein
MKRDSWVAAMAGTLSTKTAKTTVKRERERE